MVYPRAMNNKEKEGLKIVKESGLAFEVKFCYSPYSGGFNVNVPKLTGTYYLAQIEFFNNDLKRHETMKDQNIIESRSASKSKHEITNRNYWVKYGRKNGLRKLELFFDHLSGDALNAAREAHAYVEECFRRDRRKGTGRYKNA